MDTVACVTPVIQSVFQQDATCGLVNGAISLGVADSLLLVWSTGETGPVLQNLPGGSYAVTITDDTCTLVRAFDIGATTVLEVVLDTLVPVGCEPLGYLAVRATGGRAPYAYYWADGVQDSVRTGLVPGNYSLYVVDTDGCGVSATYTIGEVDCPPDPPAGGVGSTVLEYEVNYETPYYNCLDNAPDTVLVCGVPTNGIFQINPAGCFAYQPFGEYSGLDTVCLLTCTADLSDCDTVLFIFDVQPPFTCAAYFTTDSLTVTTTHCADARVCLPFAFPDRADYSIHLDGLPYQEPLDGCDYLRTQGYSYQVLPLGASYAFQWRIDGQVYNGTFDDLDGLLTLLQVIDPAGMWVLDGAAQFLQGGTPDRDYGELVATDLQTGAQATLPLNVRYTPNVAAVSLEAGPHELILQHAATGCADTLTVMVHCSDVDSLVVYQNIGTVDTLCLPVDLPGSLYSVVNRCPAEEVALLTPLDNTGCILIEPLEVGTDSSCWVLCDSLGYCDTLYLTLHVFQQPPPDVYPPVAVDDAGTGAATQLVRLDLLPNDTLRGALDTIYLVDPPAFGTATVDHAGWAVYTPDPAYCDAAQPDAFTYAICTAAGCDTATVRITIHCGELLIYTGFSPNGDGINDTFTIQNVAAYPNNELLIYNRWGNEVYRATDYANDWAGRCAGQALPDGTYFYVFRDGRGGVHSGYVQLGR